METIDTVVCPHCGLAFLPPQAWTNCPDCNLNRYIIEAVMMRMAREREEE